MKIISLDLLGGINYPKRVIEIIDHVAVKFPEVKLNVRFIANAKGWSETAYKPLVSKVIKKPNVCVVGLHGLWEDSHKFTEKHIPKAKEIGQVFNEIAKKNPEVKCYYSPCLEHEMSLDLAKKFYNACQFSNLTYVNSYIKSGAKLPNVINEVHHNLSSQKPKYIHSFDGLDQLDVDMNKYKDVHAKAEYFYSWSWFCNQKVSKKDTTKRENRKLLPQLRMINVMIYQALHRYPPKHKLLKGRIYKAYAEAHLDSKGQADSRSYSMVFLTTGTKLRNGKVVFPKEILFKAKGKVLARLTFSGTMHGDQRIYRSITNPFAVDIWNEAKKLNKKGVVNVWEDKQRVGLVLPIFRAGDYRNYD